MAKVKKEERTNTSHKVNCNLDDSGRAVGVRQETRLWRTRGKVAIIFALAINKSAHHASYGSR